MKGFSYSVCPICGSFTVSSSPIAASCCGQPLARLEMVEAPDGMISIRHDDEGIIASIDHPMTKDEYISFIALESWDGIVVRKLYPEWNEDVHLPGFRGRLIWAMNDGRVFCRKV